MTTFVNGKQVRVRRPQTIDGMDADEFIRRNADPIWLHQNEMWELMEETPDDSGGASRLFEAEAAYAESIFRGAIGDTQASIAAAERALDVKPDYPPAILTMGSIEYQRGRVAEGARLFRTLLSLPDESGDLWELIDKAGDFLIQQERYAEGLELYEAAVRRFPDKPGLYQGLGCCAGHEKLFDRALEVSRKALDLEPDRPDLTGDLGWTLFLAGRLDEAEEVLSKAVDLDPSDERACGNLRLCRATRSGYG